MWGVTTKHLSAADNGQTISVKVGDLILLRLDENPTTGYQWQLEPLDERVLELSGTSFELSPSPTIGSGGTREFRFTARAAGHARIALKHWQPWSGESSVTQRFSVGVDVSS